MIDLQVLAYRTDLTRVITFAIEREGGSRAYPEIGIADDHHSLSHHQNNAVAIDKLFQINSYLVKLFSYYLEKLRSVPDGDGNLLDNMVMLYGSALSDGNSHMHENLPLLMVGGAGSRIRKAAAISARPQPDTHDESASGRAGQVGGSGGETWRQHRKARPALCLNRSFSEGREEDEDHGEKI